MRIALLAMIVAFLPGAAAAAFLDVQIVNPTQYTDNSPLAAADLVSNRWQLGTCADAAAIPPVWGALIEERIVPAAELSVRWDGLADGTTYCFRAYTTARTPGAGEAESVSSAVIAKSTPLPVTKRPKRGTLK